MGLRRLLPALILALLVAPLGAQGELSVLSLIWERDVARTVATESDPAVAVAPDGTTVVAWRERSIDTSTVLLSSFDPAGEPLLTRLPVNSSSGFLSQVQVGIDSSGNILVGYLSGGLQLHGYTAAGQERPALRRTLPAGVYSLAVAPGGLAAVAYANVNDATYNPLVLRLLLLDQGGAEQWTQVLDEAENLFFTHRADVAIDGAGNTAVVFADEADEGRIRYVLRSYDVRGGLRWGDDDVDGGTAQSSLGPPQVAADDPGNVVVVWEDVRDLNPGSAPVLIRFVRYRRYSPGGARDTGTAPTLLPAEPTTPEQRSPRVAAVEAGVFAVGWLIPATADLSFARLSLGTGRVEAPRIASTDAQFYDLAAAGGAIALAWENTQPSSVVRGLEQPTVAPAQLPAGIVARLYAPTNAYSLSGSTASASEGSREPVVFTVSRAQTAGASSVGYSFEGTASFGGDYTLVAPPAGVVTETGSLRFENGQDELRVTLAIVDDPLGEPLKTIVFRLRSLRAADDLSFPVALVTLGDNDLAEVRIVQTAGGTVVRRGEPPDRLAVSLRTAPSHPVEVTLTPTDRRLSVGRGYGTPIRLTFAADESAKVQQWVEVSTLPAGAGAGLAANAGISLAARSEDPGYDRGARFTVDGRDLGTIPVEVVTRPGENPNPPVPSAYLPLVVR